MGLFDAILGRKKLKGVAKSDRLFAMSTAAVPLDLELGLKSAGEAALVFKALPTADFARLVSDMEELVGGGAAETDSKVRREEDSEGYSWMVVADPDVEDLVVTLNMISGELQAGGYGERLLAAIFSFRDEKGKPVYWIYGFKRGAFWPFVPTGDNARDNERELRLQAQASSELPVEPELERWYAIWGIPI